MNGLLLLALELVKRTVAHIAQIILFQKKIISQQLIPNIENGRSLAIEILINTPSIKALIRENNIHQINSYIKSGSSEGMIQMDDSLTKLYNEGVISKDNMIEYAIDSKAMIQSSSSIPKQPNI